MMRWIRRLFWLSVLVGGAYGGYVVSMRRKSTPAELPQWAPSPPKDPEPSKAAAMEPPAGQPETAAPRWVAPVDGVCPAGYLIKAGANSGIYHVPGGRFYERTTASRCYATVDDAVADGYRPAKA